jgi:ABC-type multidrug transport system fused ATPase/permease subunit
VTARAGDAQAGPDPSRGIDFRTVSFAYPGAETKALNDINLQIRPGESLALVGENGSGKTTLIKLLTRLYEPTEGEILLDGLSLTEWSVEALRQRIGVIFQDFGRYQFSVGENIGAGDVRHIDDADRWQKAATTGMAAPFIESMPEGYNTQLGRWFKGGRELSGGQWQKIALSRAFMRSDADIQVLDEPTEGEILLDGLSLAEWSVEALRQRIGVIFQDFGRYQFSVGENIGAGDVRHIDDADRWQKAATTGMAAPFIESMPEGYNTQLGRWFKGGRELSGGQWQKIALSRAFMRSDADILVLDEPTAAMDAASEAAIFEHFRSRSDTKMTILISHRFSTVRAADRIIVIHAGEILEQGNHESLLAENGQYASLFKLQAKGYQ